MGKDVSSSSACPLPFTGHDKIQLSHGDGGTMTSKLIDEVFLKNFSNKYLNQSHDGAVFQEGNVKLAFTTDSFVVDPLFFPGGNIGELSVFGTINDLAMCGAEPKYISAAFIIEEGLEIETLRIIAEAMKEAARKCDVEIVTGDTKVVEKGKGDKLFISTSGIGIVRDNVNINPKRAKPGDRIILSGTIGDHGIAILAAREKLNIISSIKSDTAPLHIMVKELIDNSIDIHVLRDPTRGGTASVLYEIAEKCSAGMLIDETRIPVNSDVKSICELLGFDPLYIANEGKLICIVSEDQAEKALQIIRNNPLGHKAEIIGEVIEEEKGKVLLKTAYGITRKITMLTGRQLPRIC